MLNETTNNPAWRKRSEQDDFMRHRVEDSSAVCNRLEHMNLKGKKNKKNEKKNMIMVIHSDLTPLQQPIILPSANGQSRTIVCGTE